MEEVVTKEGKGMDNESKVESVMDGEKGKGMDIESKVESVMDGEKEKGMETELFRGRPTDVAGRSEDEVAVYDLLDSLGIEYDTLWHPAAFTMEDCEAVRKRIDAPVFKNLFLTNKQGTLIFLLMIPADKPFKTKYLSSQLGCARLSFASAEMMQELLHISPGAVSPMGLVHDKDCRVRLIVDRDLANVSRYACHPCVNTASIALSLTDLLEKVVPATGHTPTWVTLPV